MPRVCLPIVAAITALIFVVLISGASGEELLVNGGFETGDTQGWGVAGNELQISTVAHSGGYAGQLTSDGLEQNMKIYQAVLVQATRKYQFSGWILQNDPAVTQVIDWFDAGDNLVLISQSQQLTDTDAAYRPLTTGELTPPPGAAWARAFVSVAGSGTFTVYVDDLSLSGIDPPLPTGDTPTPNDSVSTTPSPTPSPSVSPAPTGSLSISPTATHAPTASPTRTPTPSPTRTPATRTPVPTPAEPRVFQRLTNAGFEELRDDGKVGGEIAVTDEQHVEGGLALAISSATSSTKWAYEAISVTPGAYYSADAWAMNAAGGDTLLLRVSWYASDDASGSAIDSADSLSTVSGDPGGFRQLSTGPVEAPANARSARVRLLLEPGSAAPTRAFFDGVSFGETAGPDSADPNGVVQYASTSQRNAAQLTGGAAPSATISPAALDARATPVVLANVRPPRQQTAQLGQSGGGSSTPWLALVIAVPAVAIGGFAAAEAVRARRRRARPAD